MSSLQQKDQAYVAHTYARFPVEIASGKGSIVYDTNGKRYIDMGYESVFRQQHPQIGRQYDLTIKTADDHSYVKNIEVKKVTTMNASNIAKNIHRASGQISNGDTVALYFEGRKSTADNRSFVSKGIDEARRKGYIKGPVEVWFSDKTKITY